MGASEYHNTPSMFLKSDRYHPIQTWRKDHQSTISWPSNCINFIQRDINWEQFNFVQFSRALIRLSLDDLFKFLIK